MLIDPITTTLLPAAVHLGFHSNFTPLPSSFKPFIKRVSTIATRPHRTMCLNQLKKKCWTSIIVGALFMKCSAAWCLPVSHSVPIILSIWPDRCPADWGTSYLGPNFIILMFLWSHIYVCVCFRYVEWCSPVACTGELNWTRTDAWKRIYAFPDAPTHTYTALLLCPFKTAWPNAFTSTWELYYLSFATF